MTIPEDIAVTRARRRRAALSAAFTEVLTLVGEDVENRLDAEASVARHVTTLLCIVQPHLIHYAAPEAP